MANQTLPQLFYPASVLSELIEPFGASTYTPPLDTQKYVLYQTPYLRFFNELGEEYEREKIIGTKSKDDFEDYEKAIETVKTAFEKVKERFAFIKLQKYKHGPTVPSFVTEAGFVIGQNFDIFQLLNEDAKKQSVYLLCDILGNVEPSDIYKLNVATTEVLPQKKFTERGLFGADPRMESYQRAKVILHDVLRKTNLLQRRDNFLNFKIQFDDTLANEFGDVFFQFHSAFKPWVEKDKTLSNKFKYLNSELSTNEYVAKRMLELNPNLFAFKFSEFLMELYQYAKI